MENKIKPPIPKIIFWGLVFALGINLIIDSFSKKAPTINHHHEAKEVKQFQLIINQQDSAHYENNKNIDTIVITSSYGSLYEYLKQYHGRNSNIKGYD